MLDKNFVDVLSRANRAKVIDEGSILIFRDYLEQCEVKIRKNNDFVNRIIGQNDQLKLTAAMLTEVIGKYTRMQEEMDQLAKKESVEVDTRVEVTEAPKVVKVKSGGKAGVIEEIGK